MTPVRMMHELTITPSGHLLLCESPTGEKVSKSLLDAYAESAARGMLDSASKEWDAVLPPAFDFARSVGRLYLASLCRAATGEPGSPIPDLPPPTAELERHVLQVPPMTGAEYLTADVLATWWRDIDALTRADIRKHAGGATGYLRERNPQWRFVGRVTFHLAENKRDPDRPFAFLATFANGLTPQGKVKHEPLARSLQQYAGEQNRAAMLNLLLPIQRAAESVAWVQRAVDSGEIYHPLAWSPRDAYEFLKSVPQLEAAGLIVRVPDWWSAQSPARPRVSVKVNTKGSAGIGVDALLDFSVGVSLGGESLSPDEVAQLLEASGGLVPLRGKWVEIDRERLKEALEHWKEVEKDVRREGLTFFEGMRLLSGADIGAKDEEDATAEIREWTGLAAGPELDAALRALRSPEAGEATPPGLRAELRPYQQTGYSWLRFVARLGLGACLADDMGLGKTVQVIALLLDLKRDTIGRLGASPSPLEGEGRRAAAGRGVRPTPVGISDTGRVAHPAPGLRPPSPSRGEGKTESDQHYPVDTRFVSRAVPDTGSESRAQPDLRNPVIRPSLLVVPASLIANWKSELARFAPSIAFAVVHPSEPDFVPTAADSLDLVITTYGMLVRTEWLRKRRWRLAILDEAQAVKNSGTKQTRAVKELAATARVAMTGTPVENRLSDLWSLFDFLNPGLLGTSKQFSTFVKRLQSAEPPSFEPLRSLVRPYILRRLKTDKRVIADLPDKTEVKAFCTLSKQQAALYQHAVDELAAALNTADGIQRRGVVLAQLVRLKQICNHPAQAAGTNDYAADRSGKFARLAELAEEIASRQEKVLVFTQFREITEPLAAFLATLFGRTGLVLHGATSVKNRKVLVDQFQREDGPPFFVLSLKAGGTGLNLTAASHVIHFDRWWNPAVENQATDRAFRIGQKKNVLVHKFICRGTVEERIDEMIANKTQVAGDAIGDGDAAGTLLTEMDNATLMEFVKLDIRQATDG
ncbi:MAG TPA: DEAD/DEAH box helicase [Gemmataceae bacterium]|nr:DEAD/DEAH box helicase [Gemmataceae bacterium]